MPIPLAGYTSSGARPSPSHKLPTMSFRATAYKPRIAITPQPTGVPISKPIGTTIAITCVQTASTSSTLSSAVLLPIISTRYR